MKLKSDKYTPTRKCGTYALEKWFEFKVKKSCSQRYEVGCVNDSCLWRIRVARIEGLDFFSIRVFKNKHDCLAVKNMILSHH